MSLRRRLFFFVFIPIAVLYYTFGIYGVYQTRSQLVHDLDNDLVGTSAASAELLGPRSTKEITDLIGQANTDSPRLTALIDIGDDTIFINPATRNGQAQTPPTSNQLQPSALVNRLDRPFTLSSQDDTVDYRAVATRIDGGRIIVTAQALDRIDTLTRQFLIGTLLTGLMILAAMAAVVYVAIQNGLQPLKRFIETTLRVAEGDLTERVDTDQSDPAFCQIAQATNHMLDQVELSYDQQRISRERLNELVANAAHELRTPLTAIRGTVDMRTMGALDTEDRLHAAFRGIDEHSARMASIVEDLIVIARAENMRLEVQTRATSIINLPTIVEAQLKNFRSKYPGRSVELIVEPGSHEIAADDALIRTSIDQLLDNVATHTPEHSALAVTISNDDKWTHIDFNDSGPGVPSEIEDKIFERFVRADTSRARATGGAGLGLSIVRSIAESAGGHATLKHSSGQGATIQLSFPRYQRNVRPD